jgi:hypothetical protein
VHLPEWRPTHTISFLTQRRGPSTHLLHLGLLAAIVASDTTPTLSFQSKRALKKDLQKYQGSSGFITRTTAIQPPTLSRLHTVLESLPCHLLTRDNKFELIMDSGCSKSVSPCATNFVPGYLVDLTTPLTMDGITGHLVAHQKGWLQYKVLNDAGGITVLKCDGCHLLDLKIRMFSPQIMLVKQQGGQYVLKWNNRISLSDVSSHHPWIS